MINKLLKTLIEFTRPYMLNSWSKDSCIASTRICNLLCDHYNLKFEPIVCTVDVLNPLAAEWRQKNGPFPNDNMDMILQLKKDGIHVVGLGGTGKFDPKGWDAHLICKIENYIVDLSIDQANRPVKNIVGLKPVIVDSKHWQRDPFILRNENGVELWYYNHKIEHDYKSVPDWEDVSRFADIISKSISAIDKLK